MDKDEEETEEEDRRSLSSIIAEKYNLPNRTGVPLGKGKSGDDKKLYFLFLLFFIVSSFLIVYALSLYGIYGPEPSQPSVAYSEHQENKQSGYVNPSSAKEWKHSIFSTEDTSSGRYVRLSLRVVVPQDITEEGVKSVAKNIVRQITASRDVNAIYIYFYYKPVDLYKYHIAQVVWAPYGDWSKAGDVKTGDYSKHQYNVRML